MKIVRYTVLVVFALIWVIGVSPYAVFFPALYKNGVLEDEYRFGDLYHLSNLPQFKEPLLKCPSLQLSPVSSSRPVHLFLLGDSFTEKQRIDAQDFPFQAYHYIKWDNLLHVRPDTSAVNIVLIETVERHFRQHFENPPYNTFVPDTATFFPPQGKKSFMASADEFFESGRTEGQLGLLLFNNDFATRVKEMKAWFTYKWFKRAAERVAVSDDGAHLVYYLDTDTINFAHTSGFSPVSEARIDSMVLSINTTATELKKMGFDHVVLSVIPNKSTIVMPEFGTYNRLIERVQQDSRLKVPYVDILPEYRQLGEKAYLKNDSHWSCEGRQVWLGKTNALLLRLLEGADPAAAPDSVSLDCLGPGSIRSLISAGRSQ